MHDVIEDLVAAGQAEGEFLRNKLPNTGVARLPEPVYGARAKIFFGLNGSF